MQDASGFPYYSLNSIEVMRCVDVPNMNGEEIFMHIFSSRMKNAILGNFQWSGEKHTSTSMGIQTSFGKLKSIVDKDMMRVRELQILNRCIRSCSYRNICNDAKNQISTGSNKGRLMENRKVKQDKRNSFRKLSLMSKGGRSGENEVVFERSISNLKSTDIYTPLKGYCDPIDNVPDICPELQGVLFSPGVHYMRDPRTRHLNFSPELLNIPNVDNFKFDKVTPFVSPTHDQRLLKIAEAFNTKTPASEKKLKYYSSSSSLTGILRLFHLLLSNNRPLDVGFLSKPFPATTNMSESCKYPISSVVTLKKKDSSGSDNIFSIDSDRTTDTELILSLLGNTMELMLTTDSSVFKTYLKSSLEDPVRAENSKSSYHYARFGNILMRSQLDAKDKRLPGTGVFDLKTRAVCAIRYDIAHTNFHPTNYEINRTHGLYESFERELFEMARVVMFKYSLQARIGNMDGIFVAYHNVKNILGFQYIPLSQIDSIFFGNVDYDDPKLGQPDYVNNESDFQAIVEDIGQHWQNKREALSTMMANYEFNVSLSMLQDLLNAITKKTGSRPFRMFLKYCPESKYHNPHIKVFVNVVHAEMAKRLTTLDKVSDDVEVPPSERIRKATLAASARKKRCETINKSIFEQSSKDGRFMFKISCGHKINSKSAHMKYPTPPLSIINKKTADEWIIHYKIAEVCNPNLFEEEYFKTVKRLCRTFGIPSILSVLGDDTNSSYPFNKYASSRQNILRAYSEKAIRRLKVFKHSIFYRENSESK